MPAKPTTEQLQQAIGVICKVIAQIPCFHLYEEKISQRFLTSETETALKAIMHNAALDSTLISLRSFNEFFSSHRQYDDVRASDFPGIAMKPFLSAHDNRAIHKYLAHITVTRSDIVTKSWLIDDMVVVGLQNGVQFLSMIENSFPPQTEAGRKELRGVRDVARLLIPRIAKLDERKEI